MNSDMNDEIFFLILKITHMTKCLHRFLFEAGSLQTKIYLYCLCAIAKHDKWFSECVEVCTFCWYIIFSFLIHVSDIRNECQTWYFKQVMYTFFEQEKRGKHAFGNLQIVYDLREKIVLLMKCSPSWCLFVSFYNKIVSLDKLCASTLAQNCTLQISWVVYEYICAVVSITLPANGKCHCCLHK